MSQDPIVEETKRKLDELEQRIRAAKASPGAREIAGEAHKDWEDMLRTHAALSRKLEAAGDHSSEALEGLRLDVDVLRHSFERWMARVEGSFAQERGRKGGR
jgi:hypothetical protein